MSYEIRKYGIDISEWQDPPFDFQNFKDHFVIIRAGYSSTSGGFAQHTDAAFNDHYQRATAAGLPCGVYWYSMARTVAQAQTEADYCYNLVKNLNIPYGIWFDIEDPSISESLYYTVALSFNQRIKSNGWAGIYGTYASAAPWAGVLSNLKEGYRWVADWGANDGSISITNIPGCYIQQFTSRYKGRNLDGNVLFGVPPSGTGGKKNSTLQDVKKESIKDLALEVWRGKYGNGEARKKALGSRYNEVQAEVERSYHVARAVIQGKYGNGDARKKALGLEYDYIQTIVDILLRGVK